MWFRTIKPLGEDFCDVEGLCEKSINRKFELCATVMSKTEDAFVRKMWVLTVAGLEKD